MFNVDHTSTLQSALPKKTKVKVRAPTQDELIARALDMEEGNIVEHRNYLTLEEEKRKRARLVRTTVQGPRLRWISKSERVKVLMAPPPAPALPPAAPYGNPYNPTPYLANRNPYTPVAYLHPSNAQYPGHVMNATQPPTLSYMSSSSATVPPPPYYTYPTSALPPPTAPVLPPPPPPPIERIETVARNYVVHETAQTGNPAKPSWLNTMKAMFGDHVKWDELRVYTAKGRPLCNVFPLAEPMQLVLTACV